jgi:hypothetical protein
MLWKSAQQGVDRREGLASSMAECRLAAASGIARGRAAEVTPKGVEGAKAAPVNHYQR